MSEYLCDCGELCHGAKESITYERDDLKVELEKAKQIQSLNNWYERIYDGQKQIDALKAEVERLKEAQRFTYCAYCGWKTSVDDKAEELSRHVEYCQKHPVFIWKSLAERAREALKKSIAWMEPIMDAFSVGDKQKDGTPSARVVVLNTAKEALKSFDDKCHICGDIVDKSICSRCKPVDDKEAKGD